MGFYCTLLHTQPAFAYYTGSCVGCGFNNVVHVELLLQLALNMPREFQVCQVSQLRKLQLAAASF